MNPVTFSVPMQAAPQGSKRHVGNGVMVESSKQLKAYRESVAWSARQACSETFTEPIGVEVMFAMKRPAKPKFEVPAVRPDIDKLLRSTFDGMTDGGLIADDSLIVELYAQQVYDSLPYVRVFAYEIADAQMRRRKLLVEDLKLVVKDQKNYIKLLEAELLPYKVAQPEQEAML